MTRYQSSADDEKVEVEDDGDGGRRYDSLYEAFQNMATPSENRQLIRRVVEHISISAFYERRSYIKGVRRDGGPDLRFWYGYSNGFISEAEAIAGSGGREPWASPNRHGLYGIDHPVRGNESSGGSRGGTTKKAATRCLECGDQLALSGICNNPDCLSNY
jgi:hypothetical protein